MNNKSNNINIEKYLNTHPIKNKSITQIAQDAGVSVSALTRYAQSEGFDGFKDLKFYLERKEQVTDDSGINNHLSDVVFSLRRAFDTIDKSKLAFIAKKIIEKGNVVFFGESFTYITGQYIERKLRKINIQATTLNVASDLGIIMPNPNAVYIFISNSGQNRNIKKVAEKIYNTNTKGQIIFSITANNYSNIQKYCNETIMGYFFESDEINPYELPSVSNMVLNFILDMLFAHVYNAEKQKNAKLINAIKHVKEK